MRILLTANSRKHGGRCLAGLDENGIWVRPVSTPHGGAISSSIACNASNTLRPLDVIEFEVSHSAPLPHQGENLVIDETSIQRVGTVSSDDARLMRAAATSSWFLTDHARAIPGSMYEAVTASSSLAYIIVEDFRAIRRDDGFGTHWRAAFTLGDAIADFPLTDDLYTSSLTASTEPIRAGLCISVGERFERDNSHYKLVAGVVPL